MIKQKEEYKEVNGIDLILGHFAPNPEIKKYHSPEATVNTLLSTWDMWGFI